MQHISVKTGDNLQYLKYTPFHDVVFVLDRLRSAHNVGNIFRIAELTRINQVVTCGYTATPPHPKLTKTARECDAIVPCRHFETTSLALEQLKKEGYCIVAVETTESAVEIWDFPIPPKTAFVFGNEALGVDDEVLKCCNHFIKLPVFGFKNSLNVGNCASIVAYEVVRQFRGR
ncbi:MAG: RNA methyltransferase [Lentisphaeria bacterium]